MDGLTWEEKYLRLRDDHTSLTQKANEQDDTIRRWECAFLTPRVGPRNEKRAVNYVPISTLYSGVWG